jgi:hypothetical protein
LLHQAASLFPEAFGLERHRLRLRAGASEKLKLSFLPFQMPPLQPQPATSDGHSVAAAAAPKALTHSLLLLSDGDCGEFAYELYGEVLLPAPFLEHKATVGLQGPQVRTAASDMIPPGACVADSWENCPRIALPDVHCLSYAALPQAAQHGLA